LFWISLCNLCVLCVSVVWFYSEFINHRDTEDTEVAREENGTAEIFCTPSSYVVENSLSLGVRAVG